MKVIDISKAQKYPHFEDKDELLAEVDTWCF